MKHNKLLVFILLWMLLPALAPAQVVNMPGDYPVYNGSDLGLSYQGEKTVFKIWAPKAAAVKLRLYKDGDGGMAIETINLQKSELGTWITTVNKDIVNLYYTFQVLENGKWLLESPDIYAKAVGVNGKRGMVVNTAATNPLNWAYDRKPALKNFTDIILYELHIRDISISKLSGIQQKGKFLGLTETGTKSPEGAKTGLDHLTELGITHVHLLPSFDFNSIDETKPELNKYNWGYDPQNYNVPEGSYSSNPYDGNVRIREFKQMVQALHAKGIRVILDVVYNHTSNLASNFNQFAPFYFYRQKANGDYSDATGCGNETASEKAMMRKYMIASAVWWTKEYHLDGFRFDLMGVHDIKTMNMISDTLHKIDHTIFIYGEGWTAGESPLPEAQRAVKKNTYLLHQVAAFSDDIRDGLRGPFSDVREKGFISGKAGTAESVKFGIVASTQHPQINYSKVNYSKAPWAAEPYQTITYVSCHDDNTLFDRLLIGNPGVPEKDIIQMDKLSQAIVFTSQGVSFLHAGEEMLRTKKGVANSFESPDSVNELDWNRKTRYGSVFDYYQSLIALRKHHPAFRMPAAQMIREHLQFLETADPLTIAYLISGHANGDAWKDIIVLLNGSRQEKSFSLPTGQWALAVDGDTINEKGIRKIPASSVQVPGTSAWVLFQ
jgi:pullulanase